jgi:hypothetical protein
MGGRLVTLRRGLHDDERNKQRDQRDTHDKQAVGSQCVPVLDTPCA